MKPVEGKKIIYVQVDERLHREFFDLCKERGLRLQGGIELAIVNEIEVAKGRNPRAVEGNVEKERVMNQWLSYCRNNKG